MTALQKDKPNPYRVQHSTPNSEMPLSDGLYTAYTSQDIKIATPLALDCHVFYNLSEQWLKNPLNLHPSPY